MDETVKTEIQDLLDKTNINIKLDEVEKLLTKNVIEFDFKDVQYRVKKPTFGQKKETYNKRNAILMRLFQAKDTEGKLIYMKEVDLRKMLKELRGVDIDEMDTKLLTLQQQKDQQQLALGKAIEEKADDKTLELYKDEIGKINLAQQQISFEKAQYLEMSIENQCDTEVYLYLTYLITEKLVKEEGKEDKWVRVWNSYDEFLNSFEELVDVATYYATIISQNEIR